MKLQRLAGFGPIAALFSAVSLLVFFVIQQLPATVTQGMGVPLVVVFLLALWLWVAGLTVLVFDLEWLEHPATSTRWFRVAQLASLLAMMMPGVLALITFAGVGLPLAYVYAVIWLSAALTLLIHNIEGRRVRLIHGVLPWLGIATGVVYVVPGITFALAGIGSITYFPDGLYFLFLAELLYIVWAIWMGVTLARSKAPAVITAAASATN